MAARYCKTEAVHWSVFDGRTLAGVIGLIEGTYVTSVNGVITGSYATRVQAARAFPDSTLTDSGRRRAAAARLHTTDCLVREES
jgi:hypothetical protein